MKFPRRRQSGERLRLVNRIVRDQKVLPRLPARVRRRPLAPERRGPRFGEHRFVFHLVLALPATPLRGPEPHTVCVPRASGDQLHEMVFPADRSRRHAYQ